jgi:hypothetical protein
MKSNPAPTELFVLNVVTDNPLFEGFAVEEAPSRIGRDSLDDDLCPGFGVSKTSRKWKQISLRDTWEPPRVVGRVGSYNDYPGIDMILPAFSRRACDALKDILEPNGELLPLRTDVGEYFFHNITTIADGALDLTNSECTFWCDPPTTAVDIEYFAFHPQRLKGLTIFRICERPIDTLVSEHFVRRVEEARLNGFSFEKIWPLARGVNWRMEAKKNRSTDSDRLKAQTLVVVLPLKGPKPDRTEKRTIKKWENEADALLSVPSLDGPYLGRYEGFDVVKREYRMFFTCPEADTLADKLQPWLAQIDWTGAYLMRRYGSMWDPNAREKVTSVSVRAKR